MMMELDLGSTSVLIVGAGRVAARKLSAMGDLPATLRVVAPQFSIAFVDALHSKLANVDRSVFAAISQQDWLESQGEVARVVFDTRGKTVELIRRAFQDGDLHGCPVVFAASSDEVLNGRIAEVQKGLGFFVSDASNANSGNLRSVANAKFDNLEVGVASYDAVPVVSRWICGKLAEQVSPALDRFVGLCAKVRDEAKRVGISARDGAWDQVLSSNALALLETGDDELAMGEIRRCLL